MATPHPQYSQPGPSSLPYPLPSHPVAFRDNSTYQVTHQIPSNAALSVHPPRLVNGVGHAPYPHQVGHPGSHFPPYQAGLYHHMDFSHNARSPQTPYQLQTPVSGAPLGRSPNGPPRQGQFVPSGVQQQALPPFSPPYHPYSQFHPRSSPNDSPSAFPKQVLMPPPASPLQSQVLTTLPHANVHPDTSAVLKPPEPRPYEPHVLPSSLLVGPQLSPSAHPLPSPLQSSLEYEVGSPSATSPSLSVAWKVEPSEPYPYQPFPDRTNILKGLALQSRRPSVSDAVAFTVSSAAHPPLSYYDAMSCPEQEDHTSSSSPKANDVLQTPLSTLTSACIGKPDGHNSPPEQGLASSISTTTPATSTASHTPTPSSPNSSMTSVSLSTKSPSGLTLEIMPSPSVKPMATTILSPATEIVQQLAPIQQSQISTESAPSQLPVKKTFASLLRSSPNETSNVVSSTRPNGLPISSVQGFSIPASSPTTQSAPFVPSSDADLVTLLTVPSALAGQSPPIHARGIVNLGNMCFANTVLQSLVYCPPFNKLFTELDRHVPGPGAKESSKVDGSGTSLVNATVAFMKEFRTPPPLVGKAQEQDREDSGRDSLVPSYIYDALKDKKRFDSMRGGQQEDAEEFLGFYLDTLEEELLSMITNSPPALKTASDKNTAFVARMDESSADGWLEVGKKNKTVVTRTHKALESPISRIFGGQFRTALKGPGARETVMVDPWSRLQLDIQPDHIHNIEDALRNIATPGTVHVTSSSRPSILVEASQQTLIETLPPILVLHLKRFLYDTTMNDVVKLSKKVAFGTELEIPKDVMAPAQRSRVTKYKLFGVLNHHGSSATGGHYTLDVLHPDPHDKGCEGWIRIDDEFIQNIRVDDLPVKDIGDDRSAYLLLYRRVHPSGSSTRM